MKTNLNTTIYDADLYLRLSKDDGDKEESDSIVNQKELIREFLKSRPDIRIHEIRVDDGYSGVNFERPAFQKMLSDIKEGKVNCVIVKDLSRFGRNYIEVGKYIEKIFPYLGVRFIAINDHYDSSTVKSQNENMMIPFKNLINDAYCRDISIKIRTNLEVKRKRGDFVGAFAPYGYKKSEDDKNRLEIDEEAADIVSEIFKLYIHGKSVYKIAEHLNGIGILTPMEYKRSLGSKYYTGFKRNQSSVWSHVTVMRILKNYVYTGALIQGKETTPNYKVKKKIAKDEQLWDCVEDIHDPIVTVKNYNIVQKLLKEDTRTGAKEERLYPLSGIVKCGDCKSNMSRKTVPSGKRKFVYYVCSNHKYNKNCSSHSINAEQLEKSILAVLNHHIEQAIYIEKILREIEKMPYKKNEVMKRNRKILSKQEEIKKYNNMRIDLYEDYQEKLITKEEYLELKDAYREKADRAVVALEQIQKEIDTFAVSNGTTFDWIESIKEYGKIKELSRGIAVSLLDEVLVYEKLAGERYGRIEVHFKYKHEFETALSFIASIKEEKTNETGGADLWLEQVEN
ncbi:MAG: recombinase family protein [Hespellia sp.]|nr:recombinase family protein [Hespellia sp.]